MQQDFLIARAGSSKDIRIVGSKQVGPDVREADANVEILQISTGDADVLQLWQELAIQVREVVTAQKHAALLFGEESIKLLELVFQMGGIFRHLLDVETKAREDVFHGDFRGRIVVL